MVFCSLCLRTLFPLTSILFTISILLFFRLFFSTDILYIFSCSSKLLIIFTPVLFQIIIFFSSLPFFLLFFTFYYFLLLPALQLLTLFRQISTAIFSISAGHVSSAFNIFSTVISFTDLFFPRIKIKYCFLFCDIFFKSSLSTYSPIIFCYLTLSHFET